MAELTLKQQIQEAMKAAMRAQDKEKLNAVRLMLADIKRVEVDERIEVDDARVLSILDKMLKQRRDSITQFKAAKRQDLVQKEEFEVAVIQSFMPLPLTQDDLAKLVTEALSETGAGSVRDMGKVMAWLKPKVQGRTDLGALGAIIKSRLSE
ncbi:MAG TPA: GatB/YqeY domain-containing protein [Gammaproteobacteria bacterium]|nr:GatB/YqeY domain-containing protein [Gammaproteobacteria bacterium]